MARKPIAVPRDLREPWQIANAAKCGCKGSDDMCPCQNDPARFAMDVFVTAAELRDQSRAELTTLRAKLKAAEGAIETAVAWDALHDGLPAAVATKLSDALATIRSKP